MKTDTTSAACGCCEGVEALTPEAVENRPGLNALRYRAGTHATFFETMQARLSTMYLDIPVNEVDEDGNLKSARLYPLANLKTRSTDDPAIALLDAWATVADVLTFYQERIANEGFLRTATERRSVLELARLVGYRLRPGVASTVYPAFTLEENYELDIPAGTRSQSIPDPGETMQTFETSEAVKARTAWNAIKPRPTRPQFISNLSAPNALYFKGINTNLKPNDPLLVSFSEFEGNQGIVFVQDVEVQAEADRTKVTLQVPSTAAATAMMVVNNVHATLERYSAVENFGVNPQGGMARRVLNLMQNMRANISAGATPETVNAVLRENLQQLNAERQLAVENNYARLTPWIGGMVDDLNQALRSASLSSGTSNGHSGGVVTFSAASSKENSLQGLFNLVEPLTKPASIPPASSRKLGRSVTNLFSAQADMIPRLLTVIRPSLGPALYSAWGNIATPTTPTEVYALRQTASLFGHNAPKQISYPEGGGVPTPIGDWPLVRDEFETSVPIEEANAIYLDAGYPKILPESWLVVRTRAVVTSDGTVTSEGYLYAKARNPDATQSRAEYGLSGKTTRIELGTPGDPAGTENWITVPDGTTGEPYPEFQAIRRTIVYAQSEKLELAEEPIFDLVSGDEIELDGLYDGLETGRWMIVSGERADVLNPAGESLPGVQASELVMLAGVTQGISQVYLDDGQFQFDLPGDTIHTTIQLAKPLAYTYKRDTVVIYGNVSKSTHGETRLEVLGSGDGSQVMQQFTLRQPPLTFVSAPTVSGIETTLQVRINDILWHEADNLFVLGPNDRSYISRNDDAGKTSVTFGDGVHGARLPTGSENVRAQYRSGIGKPGNVRAGQISLLATKPLGVKSVINPLPATGGADAESRDQARRNVPLAVQALDRLVSVQDYADFARTFAGIGKASAVKITDGRRQVVHVTIAGEDDIPIDPSSDLYRNLLQALSKYGDPHLALQLALREMVMVVMSARVRVHPDYLWELVEPQVRAALLQAFGFANRLLGQGLARSELISAIQGVRGVSWVDIDVLGSVPESLSADDMVNLTNPQSPAYLGLATVIPSELARLDNQRAGLPVILPAQMVMFNPLVPDTLILSEISA